MGSDCKNDRNRRIFRSDHRVGTRGGPVILIANSVMMRGGTMHVPTQAPARVSQVSKVLSPPRHDLDLECSDCIACNPECSCSLCLRVLMVSEAWHVVEHVPCEPNMFLVFLARLSLLLASTFKLVVISSTASCRAFGVWTCGIKK